MYGLIFGGQMEELGLTLNDFSDEFCGEGTCVALLFTALISLGVEDVGSLLIDLGIIDDIDS